MMDEQMRNRISPENNGAILAVGIICLVLGITGLADMTSNPAGSTFRPVLGILMLVAGLIGFAVNLVVFLRQRKK